MDEGEILALILALYLLADFILWAKGRPTLTRWVIGNMKARRWFAWLVFAFIVWLFLHWEVSCILFNVLCGVPL